MKHDYYYAIFKCLFIDADKVYISNGNLDVSTLMDIITALDRISVGSKESNTCHLQVL